jgi:hypothetical protein
VNDQPFQLWLHPFQNLWFYGVLVYVIVVAVHHKESAVGLQVQVGERDRRLQVYFLELVFCDKLG